MVAWGLLLLALVMVPATAFLPSVPQTKKGLTVSPRSFMTSKRIIDFKGGIISSSTTTDGRQSALFASLGDGEDEDVGFPGLAATALGVVAAPVVLWSEYTLWKTGCGLPAGPGGALGALEGISYLTVVGIAGWSLYNKSKTGKGLPAGPAGLLGAVEGLSFLALLVGAVVLGLTVKDYGSIPEAVPIEGGRCSGI